MIPTTALSLLLALSFQGSAGAPEPVSEGSSKAQVPAAREQATSMLARPVYLGEEPPETRSLRHIMIHHRDVPGVSRMLHRTPDEAMALAQELHTSLEGGADFRALVDSHSDSPLRRFGGIMGSFARGMLEPRVDRFLFEAEIGAVSEPFATPAGVLLCQRVDTLAGCRQLLVNGTDPASRAKVLELLGRARAGDSFADLAREHSDDPVSAARGGALSIFERGPTDTLLKKAAFEAEPGEIVGPVVTSQGFHLVQRVAPEELDPELADLVWVRPRAILLFYGGAPDVPFWVDRSQQEAAELAHELHARIVAGEDMATLAREFDDDPGGAERGGDVGWVHRRAPNVAPVLDRLFRAAPGTLFDPIPIPQGWIVLRRER